MQMDRLSASVEEACLNAWPALKEIFYDGWLIRLAEGETRRTNSVNVLAPGRMGLDEKIAYCERVYRAHGLPAYYRIRSNDDPALEQALVARGFRGEDETRTLFMDFAKVAGRDSAGPRRRNLAGDRRRTIGWRPMNASRGGARAAASDDIRRRLLDLVGLPIAFAALRDADGRIVSRGLWRGA